jgi:DNA-binding transcriptional regulator GbsR (MarR family)
MASVRRQQKEFIEAMGIRFDEAGMPRMAGRILGSLLICDPPHQSAAQLADQVESSKASISTMTRLLMGLHLVERMTLPGDRCTYYRVKENAWTELLKLRTEQIKAWRIMADQGLALMKGQPPESKRRLEQMRTLHLFFERELPVLIEHWEDEQGR